VHSIFLQIGVVTIVAAGLGIVARLLRQPILVAYMAAGILLGSGGFHLITNPDLTQDIATIGIIFLLFLVGLELDVGKIKRLGRVVLITGFAQMIVTFGAAYGVTRLLGYSAATGVYLGLAAMFSSTAAVLKHLADRRDMASLYAKVTVGILLLQDVVAILVLILISGVGHGNLDGLALVAFGLRGAGFILGTWLVTRYLLGPLFGFIARSAELLFLTSVAWAFLFAVIADSLGFSKEIGAFLAGISLATLPYNLEIIGRVKPLKDFFLVIFFVVLGLEISWGVLAHNLPLIVLIAGVVLLLKSLVGSIAMVRSGYPKRPSYLTGAGLGQMSEFSLLVVLLGASLGHVSHDIVGITAGLLIITITLNTYWNSLNRYIYPVLVVPLTWLGGRVRQRELAHRPKPVGGHILLFGANRMGHQLLATLGRMKKQVMVVDHNPEVIKRLLRKDIECVFGDIEDLEFLQEMGLAEADMVVSTIPNLAANLYLIEQTRESAGGKTLIVLTAEQVDEALELYDAGADYVILPHLLGGEQAARLLEGAGADTSHMKGLIEHRRQHITQLKAQRRELAV
jgi:Kef-type K+ transport system membrane component KefB/Trk K+ transport system NAD-binding subunit